MMECFLTNILCQIYREHLLEKALQIILSPGQKFVNGEQKKNDIKDALFYMDLLKDNVTVDAKIVFGANAEDGKDHLNLMLKY